MSRRIEDLDKRMIPKAKNFIEGLKNANIPFVVTSTLRTMAEQEALYAQGRVPLEKVNELRKKAKLYLLSERENSYTVTNCDGVKVKSNHQGGLAMDVVPMDERGNPIWPDKLDPQWRRIAEVGEGVGLIWGGRWEKFPDLPHWELHV